MSGTDGSARLERLAAAVAAVRTAILDSPGASSADPAVAAYVATVQQAAHRITDGDVAEVTAAGFSEDQIFELTAAAALEAADQRLRAGLTLLEGGER
jgi:alkylhydroperoxidase family enzyme